MLRDTGLIQQGELGTATIYKSHNVYCTYYKGEKIY
jgi:hypothetical protein